MKLPFSNRVDLSLGVASEDTGLNKVQIRIDSPFQFVKHLRRLSILFSL